MGLLDDVFDSLSEKRERIFSKINATERAIESKQRKIERLEAEIQVVYLLIDDNRFAIDAANWKADHAWHRVQHYQSLSDDPDSMHIISGLEAFIDAQKDLAENIHTRIWNLQERQAKDSFYQIEIKHDVEELEVKLANLNDKAGF